MILLFYHYPTAKVRKKNEFIIFSLLKRHMFANKEEPHPQPLYSLSPAPSPNGEGSEYY